jgi:hypothetical protein
LFDALVTATTITVTVTAITITATAAATITTSAITAVVSTASSASNFVSPKWHESGWEKDQPCQKWEPSYYFSVTPFYFFSDEFLAISNIPLEESGNVYIYHLELVARWLFTLVKGCIAFYRTVTDESVTVTVTATATSSSSFFCLDDD